MKILQVTTVGTTINAFLLPFAKEFKNQGWQVDAAAEGVNDFPNIIATHDNVYNVEFCRNPLKIKQLLTSVVQIRRLIKRNGYDVVHVHTPIAAFLTRLATVGLIKTKIFYTAHGFHYINTNTKLKNFIFYLAEKITSFKTEHLFVINDDDYKFAIGKKIAIKDKVTKMYGIGVDESLYQFNADVRIKKRGQLNIEHEFIILQIAELNHNKNQQQILHALAKLKKQQLGSFKYILAGAGPELQRLELLTKQLNLTNDVQFLGFRNDVQDLISAADVLCLSSQREGLPRCIMEAMCAERPIIASNIRGCNDLLSSGCGILVQYNNTDAWVEGFKMLINNAELRTKMGRRGLQHIKQYYTENDVVNSVVKIYQRYV